MKKTFIMLAVALGASSAFAGENETFYRLAPINSAYDKSFADYDVITFDSETAENTTPYSVVGSDSCAVKFNSTMIYEYDAATAKSTTAVEDIRMFTLAQQYYIWNRVYNIDYDKADCCYTLSNNVFEPAGILGCLTPGVTHKMYVMTADKD